MQPNRSHSYRRLTRNDPLRSIRSLAVLSALILVTLVTACGSGGGSSGGGSSGESTPCGGLGSGESPCQIPATPPDVPSQAPPCTGSLDQRASVRADLQGLISACSDPQGDKMEVTNISQFVLDITPAAGTSAQLNVTSYDTSSDPVPTAAGVLEVEAQNTVVQSWSPDNPATSLLPVGGTLMATTSYPPVQLSVNVDQDVSGYSFGAAALTSYVVSNVGTESPGDYYQSIADCINATYQLWQELVQQQPPTVLALMNQALASSSCGELVKKVTDYLNNSDPLSVAAERGAEHAGEPDWISKFNEQEQVQDVIKSDTR